MIVTIHSKTDCPYCDQARSFLIGNAIPYTEIKHDDTADRQALYDRLGLVDKNRTVPQIVLNDDGEDYLIGGAKQLMLSGIQSLFKVAQVDYEPAQSVLVEAEPVGMVVAEEGHSCCE